MGARIYRALVAHQRLRALVFNRDRVVVDLAGDTVLQELVFKLFD